MTPEMQVYSNSIKFSQIAKIQQASVNKSSRKLLEPLSFKKNVELFIPQTINTNQLSSHISRTDLMHEEAN
jgi:PhoPQ-activated pathogenicity-related protein